MITIKIKIKTPLDYWKQLKEWMREPRQAQCKEIVDYYISLLEYNLMHSLLSEQLNEEQSKTLVNSIYDSKKEAYRWIEKYYPKYNLSNDNNQWNQ